MHSGCQRMKSRRTYRLTVYFQLAFLILIFGEAVGQEITADPVELAVEPGEQAEFTCSWSEQNSTKATIFHWSKISKASGNNAETKHALNATGTGSRYEITDGVLKITNVTFDDAGKYQCGDDAGSGPATVELIVYDMPSYETEGFILLVVCAAMLAFFIIGVVLMKRSQNKMLKRGQFKKRRLYSYQSSVSVE